MVNFIFKMCDNHRMTIGGRRGTKGSFPQNVWKTKDPKLEGLLRGWR